MTSDTDAGALSSQGRFQRMEDALIRIEAKLDAKADAARLIALEDHVRDLEAGRIVSPLSQLYLSKFNDLEKAVETLDEKDKAREAVSADRERTSKERMRWISIAAGVATTINVVLAVVVTIGSLN